jgi:exopolysaccharide biosynthesis protein
MKNALRIMLSLTLIAALLLPAAALADIIEIAPDVIKCPEPRKDGLVDEMTYEDPSISVRIETGKMFDSKYFAAHIKIANATQIRSYVLDDFYSTVTKPGYIMAGRVNAVLAIDGDFCERRLGSNTPIGFVVRQGVEYRRNIKPLVDDRMPDILIIDDQGDFTILPAAKPADVDAFEGKVMNAYTFGPGLVINGEKQTGFKNMNNGANVNAQRMCIAQVGELEYLLICCTGPDNPDSKGLTLEEFAELVYSFEGVQNAYNLDGGVTTWMVFKQGTNSYAKINGTNPKKRPIADILYFATAWKE